MRANTIEVGYDESGSGDRENSGISAAIGGRPSLAAMANADGDGKSAGGPRDVGAGLWCRLSRELDEFGNHLWRWTWLPGVEAMRI